MVVEDKKIKSYAAKHGIADAEAEALCKDKKVIQAVFEECMSLADAAKFNSLERPK
jgi:uncharacterized protein YpmB